MEKRKEEAPFFFFFSKWPPDTFSKTTGRPIFSRWLPVFCFNGPHLDSGYDISLFRAGFGKRSYFYLFFNSKKKEKKSRRPQKRKRAGTLNMFVFLLHLTSYFLIFHRSDLTGIRNKLLLAPFFFFFFLPGAWSFSFTNVCFSFVCLSCKNNTKIWRGKYI